MDLVLVCRDLDPDVALADLVDPEVLADPVDPVAQADLVDPAGLDVALVDRVDSHPHLHSLK